MGFFKPKQERLAKKIMTSKNWQTQMACVEKMTDQKLLLKVAKSPPVERKKSSPEADFTKAALSLAVGAYSIIDESLSKQSRVRQIAVEKLTDPKDLYDVAVNAKDINVPAHAVAELTTPLRGFGLKSIPVDVAKPLLEKLTKTAANDFTRKEAADRLKSIEKSR